MVYVVHAVNYSKGVREPFFYECTNMILTTVADFAAISKSVDSASMVTSRADMSGPESKEISRRHSVTRALKMFNDMSNELCHPGTVSYDRRGVRQAATHALERLFPVLAFLTSATTLR